MRLTKYHFLPALKFSARRQPYDGVVIHYTGGGSGRRTAQWIATDNNCRVSWHFIICRDGHTIQQVPLDHAAWHAGLSEWPHSSGETYSNANDYAIGIELANRGPLIADSRMGLSYESHGELVRVRNGNARNIDGQFWEEYTDEQLAALDTLLIDLAEAGVPTRLFGHNEIAVPRGRKTDPGPLFPWDRYRYEEELVA
jgi:N-acetylmuramoyl-L-alanine amidase